jgi:hypothetical protein
LIQAYNTAQICSTPYRMDGWPKLTQTRGRHTTAIKRKGPRAGTEAAIQRPARSRGP